jgi:hypothetical protein
VQNSPAARHVLAIPMAAKDISPGRRPICLSTLATRAQAHGMAVRLKQRSCDQDGCPERRGAQDDLGGG